MLTNLSLSNFKCFENLDLPIKPLTLLCGLNGTGKSSVIQALLVLSQSAHSLFPSERKDKSLLLNGRFTDLGTGRDVLCAYANQETIEFKLQDDLSLDLCLNSTVNPDDDQLPIGKANTSDLPDKWSEVPPFCDKLIYVSAGRIGPQKTYSLSYSSAGENYLGAEGELTINYLNTYKNRAFSNSDPHCTAVTSKKLLDTTNYWLQEVSPDCRLDIDETIQADLLVAGYSFDQVGDARSNAHRMTHPGFGLSYVLPVVVAFLSQPGFLCLVENPESHLHPQGQTMLAKLAAHAAKSGVQLIVETHSDHFFDGVRIAVRNGLLNSEDTAIHYFERVNGRTTVTSPTIDSDGRVSEWPTGFFDQHELNLSKLLCPIN